MAMEARWVMEAMEIPRHARRIDEQGSEELSSKIYFSCSMLFQQIYESSSFTIDRHSPALSKLNLL